MECKNFNKKLEQFIKDQKLDFAINYCDFKNSVKIYIASEGLFSKIDQLGLEIIADVCEQMNLNYYLPQHADFNDKGTQEFTITNKMIADGDNKQLKTCNFVLAHIKAPIDEGVAGEISRFKTMSEYEPSKYYGVVGWADDIRSDTVPSSQQKSFNNQCIYLNQYCIGEIMNSLGCYEKLGDCFVRMYDKLIKRKVFG